MPPKTTNVSTAKSNSNAPAPSTDIVQELRAFVIGGRDQLLSVKPSSQPGREWLESYSALIDETLRRIYNAAWQSASAAHGLLPDGETPDRVLGVDNAKSSADAKSPDAKSAETKDDGVELALLAIGGYGREELCPFSDIDIAFVPGEEEHPLLDLVIKEAFRLVVEVLIDGAKIEVGYAYRPIADCARLDHTAKAALLESRLVAGSARLQKRLNDELHYSWDEVEFLLDKVEERRVASSRLRLSLYAVEPNLKEGTGALREIHTALWAAGALHRSNDPLRDLEWRGIVTAEDVSRVRAANELFLKLRLWLHLKAGKKTDILRVELQDDCARAFGYSGTGARASQDLLAEYYRHAEYALRFSEKVMRRLLQGPLELDEHFVARSRRIEAAHPFVLRNHPELLMTPFVLSHKYQFPLDADLDLQIEEAMPLISSAVRRSPIMRAGFFALLARTDDVAQSLCELRSRGILQRFIPEFGQMLHLAPADPMHELSVGEHCLYAVKQLHEMWLARGSNEFLMGVWDGVDDLELLVLGTLLHDIGKIEFGSDHSVSGERLVRVVAARLEMREERIERLQLLVRRHLLLPRVARLRDLSSPGTILDVMEHVRDVPTLKMLYLLSLADTKAVSERAYSATELGAMRELYERVLIAMTRQEAAEVLSEGEARQALVQRERARLRREMRHLELDDETLRHISENLPASYVLNTPLETVAIHLRLLEQLPQERVIVDFHQNPRDIWTEMSVVAYDDPEPGLLSKICGVVYASGLDIKMAQVFTIADWRKNPSTVGSQPLAVDHKNAAETSSTRSSSNEDDTTENAPHIVLDLLHVSRVGRALSSSQTAKLATQIREVLLGEKNVVEVVESLGKSNPTGIIPLKVSVRNDLSDEHSVVTMVNENVPGLMFHITRALAAMKWDIHSAKVTTWAGRAEDAFYITKRSKDRGQTHSQKLANDDIKSEIERLRRRLRRAG